jgi:hypothetical protein
MSIVRVTIYLPYLLLLPPGEYPTPGEGGGVELLEVSAQGRDGTELRQTQASGIFDGSDNQPRQRRRGVEADRLLRRVNHLLRWYRVITGHATIVELTRSQASPFRFTVEGTGATWGGDVSLEYEAQPPPLPAAGNRAAFGDAVRQGLNGKTDPDVAALNLLDAEYALSVGRFREAILLCWGAIDSTFVRKFKSLVDERLNDEWTEGRDFLKGIDFGLRHKMTTGLRLLTGRSLHKEPDGFWQELSISYAQRNKIIHEGQIAHEDDAKRAIRVARRIVRIVATLPA